MLDIFFSIAIPTLIVLGALNLYTYTFTRSKNSLVAGLLLFLMGMGLILFVLL